MSRIPLVAAFAFTLLLGARQPAEAHIVASRLGDFYAGAVHPLTDPRDVVTWFAMGVLAASVGASRGRWLVLVFPVGLLIGLGAGVATGLTSAGRLADAGVMVALGLLLAAAIRLPIWLLAILGMAVAVLRGAVNAGGIGPDTDVVLFAGGLVAMGYVVITLAMALTVAFLRSVDGLPPDWRGITVRACGSWVAAVGIMMGGFALVS